MRKAIGWIAALALAAALAVGWVLLRPVEATVFVNDPCGACSSEAPCKPCDIVLRMQDRLDTYLAEAGLAGRVTCTVHNTYFEPGRSLYPAELERRGIPKKGLVQPVLLVEDILLNGWDEIETGATQALQRARYGPLYPLLARTHAAPPDTITLAESGPAIVYFGMDGCAECAQMDGLLSALTPQAEAAGVRIDRYSLSAGDLPLFDAYCAAYGLDASEAVVPAVFAGTQALQGYEVIAAALPEALETGGCEGTPLQEGNP